MLDLDYIFDPDRIEREVERRMTPGIGVEDLPPDWRVEWEKRAAAREYDSGQAREHAEAEALTEIIARMRAAGEYP